jgi:hypothetical protein
MAVGSGRPKSTSSPCHEDLPRTGGLLAKGLDEDTQTRFEELKMVNGGPEMRRIQPDVELWLDYKPGSSHSDHEVEKMALNRGGTNLEGNRSISRIGVFRTRYTSIMLKYSVQPLGTLKMCGLKPT